MTKCLLAALTLLVPCVARADVLRANDYVDVTGDIHYGNGTANWDINGDGIVDFTLTSFVVTFPGGSAFEIPHSVALGTHRNDRRLPYQRRRQDCRRSLTDLLSLFNYH